MRVILLVFERYFMWYVAETLHLKFVGVYAHNLNGVFVCICVSVVFTSCRVYVCRAYCIVYLFKRNIINLSYSFNIYLTSFTIFFYI